MIREQRFDPSAFVDTLDGFALVAVLIVAGGFFALSALWAAGVFHG